MQNRVNIKRIIWVVLAISAIEPFAGQVSASPEAGWVPLFNGKNLDGWYTFLQRSGKNNDPKRIFKVERGMIHLYDIPATQDEQEFGYLASERELSHCRIRAEFKWGEKRFAPRADDKKDSGLLYYMVGQDDFLARTLQLQIMETEVGNLWLNGGASITTSIEDGKPPTYAPGFVPYGQDKGGIVHSADFEDRNGWNTVEVILDGDRITHLVNDRVVMRAWNVRQPDPENPSKKIPLDRGRVLLEAEGAEIWFRNIQMKPLTPRPVQTRLSDAAPLSLDSSMGQLLEDPRSRLLLEVLLSPDVLRNPFLDSAHKMPARKLLPYLITLSDEQIQAFERALRAVTR